jgi:type I restriction enzyme S subunit
MNNWKYGVLDNAVNKASSNISLNKIQDDNGVYPVYGAKGLMKNISTFQQEKEYLAIIKDGAGIGRVSKHPAKSSILATMQYIIPKEEYNIDFVRYFLESVDFEDYRTGSTIPHIYYKDYKKAKFPLVGLNEQQQIVAILDQAFGAIDQAKANIEKNIANAKELFQSKLNAIFSQKGDGWEEKPLKSVTELLNGYAFKSKEFTEDGIRLLRNCNVFHGTIDWDKTANYPSSALQEFKRFEMFEDDIVLSLDRPIISTGLKLARIRANDLPCLLLQRVLCIRAIKENSDYIFHWMSSPLFINKIKPGKSLGVPHISHSEVGAIYIPIPSIYMQGEIVKVIESFRTDLENIILIYSQKLSSLEDLKKSILQKAFAGELTNKEVAI